MRHSAVNLVAGLVELLLPFGKVPAVNFGPQTEPPGLMSFVVRIIPFRQVSR